MLKTSYRNLYFIQMRRQRETKKPSFINKHKTIRWLLLFVLKNLIRLKRMLLLTTNKSYNKKPFNFVTRQKGSYGNGSDRNAYANLWTQVVFPLTLSSLEFAHHRILNSLKEIPHSEKDSQLNNKYGMFHASTSIVF